MIHIDNGPVKQKLVQKQNAEPPKQALVCSTMPTVGAFALKLQLLHMLIDHCGVTNEDEALALTNRALLNGKAVVRIGTADLIETLLHECHGCQVAQNSQDFRFTSEQA